MSHPTIYRLCVSRNDGGSWEHFFPLCEKRHPRVIYLTLFIAVYSVLFFIFFLSLSTVTRPRTLLCILCYTANLCKLYLILTAIPCPSLNFHIRYIHMQKKGFTSFMCGKWFLCVNKIYWYRINKIKGSINYWNECISHGVIELNFLSLKNNPHLNVSLSHSLTLFFTFEPEYWMPTRFQMCCV
jgi:hypothetical protein